MTRALLLASRPIMLLAVIASGNISPAVEPTGELAERLRGVTFDKYAAAPGYSEGPVWRDGDVFFCSDGLQRVSPDKTVLKYLDLGPAGTFLRRDNHIVICDNKYRALLELAPQGTVRVIADQYEGRPLRSLNDLTIDARGEVYWTDPEGSSAQNPVGSIFRIRLDGRIERVATGLAFPNGLDVDPDSKYLYVIESQSQKILRYALPQDSSLLGTPETFYDLGGSGGDGCAFDVGGNLWVADFHRPDTGNGRITVLSPKGEVLAYLPVPAKVVSNITFGGKDHDEIFCTTGDPPGVFHAKVGVKGFAGHPGKPIPTTRTLNLVPHISHGDAATLQQIAKVAYDSKPDDAKLDEASRIQIQALSANIIDRAVRKDVEELLPEIEKAAVQSARDRGLLAEVKRLNGKATLEVAAPDWLRAIAGDDGLPVFARIVELNLNERTDGHKEPEAKPLSERVNDDTLGLLVRQSHLRRLELSGTAVTSVGLVHLQNLTSLQFLNLCLTDVSDDGFLHLKKLTNLRRVTVCSSKVTGTGFGRFGGMRNLESINLHSSPASDAGLHAISKLTSLQRLEIVHTDVSDIGLKQLAALVNLRQLHVHGKQATKAALPFLASLKELYELDVYDQAASNETLSQVRNLPKLRMLRLFGGPFDDDGVKQLVGMTTLEELTLNSAKVTDASIENISNLKSLRKVNLSGTQVTSEGKTRLKDALPMLEITP